MQQVLADVQKRIADQILDGISPHRRCIALLGEWRMGKTAVLKHIQAELDHPHVYLSLAEMQPAFPAHQGKQSEDTFYSTLLEGLTQNLEDGPLLAARPEIIQPHLSTWGKYKTAFQALAIRPITLLIDDADRLEAYSWGRSAFRHLSGLINTMTNLRIILAGTDRLRQWAEGLDGKRGLWDDLTQPPLILTPLPPQLVREAFPNHPPIGVKLADLCGGHPYCLRLLSANLSSYSTYHNLKEEIENRRRQFQTDWKETFGRYWESYDFVSRQLCYLLMLTPAGTVREELYSKLHPENITSVEVDAAVTRIINTGVLIEEEAAERLQLIGLFQDWYKTHVGLVGSLHPVQAGETVLPPQPAVEKRLITEVAFFPQDKQVMVQRGNFKTTSDMGSYLPRILRDFPERCDEVPTQIAQKFDRNLALLGRDLWVEFGQTEWLKEVIRAAEEQHDIHFTIPIEMMGFPLELMPVDDTGTRRLGMFAPISRQLFKQGRSVNRDPLALPLDGGKKLRALIVAADVKQEILVHVDGRVRSAGFGMEGERDAVQLRQLSLSEEATSIYQAFSNRRDLVEQITFLTGARAIPGNQQPTAVAFTETLKHEQFDLLHFCGHGLYRVDGIRGLVFADGIVSLRELKGLLSRQNNLRFVYLSCCESGRTDSDQYNTNLLGMAQACIEAGVPAVLSMRWPIPVVVSRLLAQTFYLSFLQTGSLNQATFQAIQALDQEQRDRIYVYAAVPVLLMH